MKPARFAKTQIAEIQDAVGNARAINALSGGVDSSTVTVLGHKAIGSRLRTVFIDTGVMREKEPQKVVALFKRMGIKVHLVNTKKDFFKALKGLIDPEEKRKAFRDTFYKTLGREVRKTKARFLLQGTIAADVLETVKGVKTQHNILEQIGINPKRYGFQVLEPLKTLYKDDVRRVARHVGLPARVYKQMPFPGPGLATRVIGEVTPERVLVVRKAVSIVEDEIKNIKLFQAFAVLLNDRATGVIRGQRRFGQIIAVRAVHSQKAITADVVQLPWRILNRIRDRILREIPSVIKVVYDLTPKPPSTIEYI